MTGNAVLPGPEPGGEETPDEARAGRGMTPDGDPGAMATPAYPDCGAAPPTTIRQFSLAKSPLRDSVPAEREAPKRLLARRHAA